MNLPLFENSERGIIYFVMGVNVRICYSLSKKYFYKYFKKSDSKSSNC